MKYVALLRGINVGGNNKVPMAELKACFEGLGFRNVSTYINSGNVLFETGNTDVAQLVRNSEAAIEKQFGFKVICSVISAADLHDAYIHAPKWWDTDDEAKHNAIFVIAPKTAKEVMGDVGEAKPEYEKVAAHGSVIFWSAPIETFNRARYKNITKPAIYKWVTIRNSNTMRKLVELTG